MQKRRRYIKNKGRLELAGMKAPDGQHILVVQADVNGEHHALIELHSMNDVQKFIRGIEDRAAEFFGFAKAGLLPEAHSNAVRTDFGVGITSG